jgi:diguanylate cyclase (GGDEF)-like protein/PAS domain S-box-containing protein
MNLDPNLLDLDQETLCQLSYVERYAWISLSRDMAAVVSLDGEIMDVNAKWEYSTGYPREDIVHSYLIEYIHFDDREMALSKFQDMVTSDIGSSSVTFRFVCSDGKYKKLYWELLFSPFHEAFFCVVTDASAMADEGGESLAFRDTLTGLNNRLALEESLPSVLSKAKDQGCSTAFFYIDLDGFKEVNDTLGHRAGDTLLMRAADRMLECAGSEAKVFRIGGDEFVILMPHVSSRNEPESLARKVLDRIGSHYVISGKRVQIGASIGISLFPEDVGSPQELWDAGDESMYAAKRGGKHCTVFYSDLGTIKAANQN